MNPGDGSSADLEPGASAAPSRLQHCLWQSWRFHVNGTLNLTRVGRYPAIWNLTRSASSPLFPRAGNTGGRDLLLVFRADAAGRRARPRHDAGAALVLEPMLSPLICTTLAWCRMRSSMAAVLLFDSRSVRAESTSGSVDDTRSAPRSSSHQERTIVDALIAWLTSPACEVTSTTACTDAVVPGEGQGERPVEFALSE